MDHERTPHDTACAYCRALGPVVVLFMADEYVLARTDKDGVEQITHGTEWSAYDPTDHYWLHDRMPSLDPSTVCDHAGLLDDPDIVATLFFEDGRLPLSCLRGLSDHELIGLFR